MSKRDGFTLAELLMTVAIILLLISMLLPSLAGAMNVARSTVCRNQLRNILCATSSYASDNKERFPRSTHSALAAKTMPWGYALSPYMGKGDYSGDTAAWDSLFNGPYRCPQDPRRDRWSYGKSVWFELTSGETGEVAGVADGPTYQTTTSVPDPESTILYGELGSGSMADHLMAHFWYFGSTPEVDTPRHARSSTGDSSNFAYVGGQIRMKEFTKTFDLKKHIDYWNPGKAR